MSTFVERLLDRGVAGGGVSRVLLREGGVVGSLFLISLGEEVVSLVFLFVLSLA